METSFKPINTEAIPQSPSSDAGIASYSYNSREENSQSKSFPVLLMIITVIMFLVAGALFGWRFLLVSALEEKRIELNSKQDEVASQISDMKKFSSKFHIAKILMDNHPFVSDIFKVLEHSVQSGVVYSKFDAIIDSGSGNYNVNLGGYAQSYHSLIQQLDILKIDPTYVKYFSDLNIESFKPNNKGTVDFTIKIKSNVKGVLPDIINSDLEKSRKDYLESLSLKGDTVTEEYDEDNEDTVLDTSTSTSATTSTTTNATSTTISIATTTTSIKVVTPKATTPVKAPTPAKIDIPELPDFSGI